MKGTVFDRFLGPKNGPKILQANLIFYVVFCDTGKPDGACREAESIQKSSPRRQQSGFNKTTRRVGRMLFLMENAHCATAGDTEQNGAKHFTVARRAIVTCFRRIMIVFAGICRGKLKIVTCFLRASKRVVTNATVSLSNMPGTTSGTAVQIVRGLG